jgi:hypothetical protein
VYRSRFGRPDWQKGCQARQVIASSKKSKFVTGRHSTPHAAVFVRNSSKGLHELSYG